MKNIDKLEEKINYIFKNKDLLQKVFIHRSYLNENIKNFEEHNERMEFLGDAVLELSATKYLYDKFPHKAEGELTAIRSALVNTNSLAKKALELNLNDYLMLSKGEEESVKGRFHILANTFEALVGAIYLDSNFNIVDDFLTKNLFSYVNEIVEQKLYIDPKSHFQEIAQEKAKVTPIYKQIDSKGPDHDKIFIMGVYLNDKLIAQGEGQSKQKAEIEAAKNGLKIKGWK